MWWHKNYSSSSWLCVSSHWKVNWGWELECPLKAPTTVSSTQKTSYLFCDWFCSSWKLVDLVQLTIYWVPSWVETLCRILKKQWQNELTSMATGPRGFTWAISHSMFTSKVIHVQGGSSTLIKTFLQVCLNIRLSSILFIAGIQFDSILQYFFRDSTIIKY